MVHPERRHLREGEPEDQVEEQLKWRHALLRLNRLVTHELKLALLLPVMTASSHLLGRSSEDGPANLGAPRRSVLRVSGTDVVDLYNRSGDL